MFFNPEKVPVKVYLSTAKLFAHPKLQRDLPVLSHTELLEHQDDYLARLVPPFCNVFEPVARQLSTDVATALDYLYELCQTHDVSATPRLTGSGACVFLPINDHVDDALLKQWQTNAPCRTVLAGSL